MKKGVWHFEQLGKLILALLVLIILIGLAYAFRDKINDILRNLDLFP